MIKGDIILPFIVLVNLWVQSGNITVLLFSLNLVQWLFSLCLSGPALSDQLVIIHLSRYFAKCDLILHYLQYFSNWAWEKAKTENQEACLQTWFWGNHLTYFHFCFLTYKIKGLGINAVSQTLFLKVWLGKKPHWRCDACFTPALRRKGQSD